MKETVMERLKIVARNVQRLLAASTSKKTREPDTY